LYLQGGVPVILYKSRVVIFVIIIFSSHFNYASHVRFQLSEDSYSHMYQQLKFAITKDDDAVVESYKNQSFNFNRLNSKNKNFLHHAAQFSALKCVQSLLKTEVNVNQQDYKGRTALHFAAYWNTHDGIVQALLAAGADKALSNIEGKRPIDYAVTISMRQLLNPDTIDFAVKDL